MICLGILISIFLLMCLNYKYVNTNYYKNLCLFENRIMHRDDVPDNLEIINLGSGYARFAFDYSYIAQKGYNFAQSPQSLYYDYALLKEYENKLSKGCVVLINLPIFIFYFFNYKGKNMR